MPPRFPPRVLLLQVRRDTAALEHERVCFRQVCGDRVRLDGRNVFDAPEVSWADVRSYDVLILGGSGECSATRDYEFTPSLEMVVRRWVREGRPFLGSCWGHHFLARALGGEVRTDPSTSEIGTFAVDLAPAGRRDRLFSSLPIRFLAQMGHHDCVSALPEGVEALAHSERCPNQAMRVVDKPVYSTQFHSELGRRQMLERLKLYEDRYVEGTTVEQMAQGIRPTAAVRPLLGRFLDLYT